MKQTPLFLIQVGHDWLTETPQKQGDADRGTDIRKAAVHTLRQMYEAVDAFSDMVYIIKAYELDPETLEPRNLLKPRQIYPPAGMFLP